MSGDREQRRHPDRHGRLDGGDRGRDRLPLGIGRQIDVGTQLRVHSSCGEDSALAVFACLEQEALLDDHGTVVLLDAAGTEVARLAYSGG